MTEHEKHAANLRIIATCIYLVADKEVADGIASKAKEVATYIEQQAERERWIPVSERLPETDDVHWVRFDDGAYAVAAYDDKDWYEVSMGGGYYLENVTHWREIVGPEEG